MTRRLILMRHAKSSWADPGQADHDRPLNERGRRDAPRVGRWLRETGHAPEAALVSDARRTRETWAGVAEGLGAAPNPVWEPALYHAGPEAMLRALRAAPAVGSVLMLGHQPGIGAFAAALLAAPPADAEFAKYPTAAVSIIDFDAADWASIGWGSGRLAAFVTPKALD
jgi:phosphohistidine phosphatase